MLWIIQIRLLAFGLFSSHELLNQSLKICGLNVGRTVISASGQ